jgi:hypothetical protein
MTVDPRTLLSNYLNPFDPAKGFQALAFHWDRFLHHHELNIAQDIERERVKRIAEASGLKDGSIVSGCTLVLGTPANGVVDARLEAGRLYIRGAVHDVAARVLVISAVGVVTIGVRLRTFTVSNDTDLTLKGIAPGTRAEGEPGASALVMKARWGFDGDGEEGDFFPIYTIEDGVVRVDPPAPINDAWLNLLARYDREAHASYVVEGFNVRAIGFAGGRQSFSISEGTVNVFGYKRSRSSAYRLTVDEEPDIKTIANEPHAVSSGTQTIAVRFAPILSVDEVIVTKERTVTLTHGAFSGAVDTLPDQTAVQIIEVKQSTTTYAANTDFKLTGSSVDWTPAGSEPAPGSTYTVKYRYIDTVPPAAVTETTFQISGAADNTIAYVTYKMKLPRIDAIVVDQAGIISYVKGVSSLYAPQPVQVSGLLLKLADVTNNWTHMPEVRQVGIVRMPFSSLRDLEKMVGDLFALVAEERLQRDLSSREPTSKRGVFVDPFLDDDMRDQGIAQTGAIVNGGLYLPITPVIHVVNVPALSLDYVEEVIVEQGRITGGMKINPYQAFQPPLLQVPIDPAQDLWSEQVVSWTSVTTTRIIGSGNWLARQWTETAEKVLSSRTVEIETIRQRPITFTIDGFGPLEYLTKVAFDGVNVTPSA